MPLIPFRANALAIVAAWGAGLSVTISALGVQSWWHASAATATASGGGSVEIDFGLTNTVLCASGASCVKSLENICDMIGSLSSTSATSNITVLSSTNSDCNTFKALSPTTIFAMALLACAIFLLTTVMTGGRHAQRIWTVLLGLVFLAHALMMIIVMALANGLKGSNTFVPVAVTGNPQASQADVNVSFGASYSLVVVAWLVSVAGAVLSFMIYDPNGAVEEEEYVEEGYDVEEGATAAVAEKETAVVEEEKKVVVVTEKEEEKVVVVEKEEEKVVVVEKEEEKVVVAEEAAVATATEEEKKA